MQILLSSFVSSNDFCGGGIFIEFSTWKIVLFINKDHFNSSFLIWMAIIFFLA